MTITENDRRPLVRSLLFVPGDDERKLAKGLTSAADALILDLEDSVAPVRKPVARELCSAALRTRAGSQKLFVRINALNTDDALFDLAAIVAARPDGVVLPKCRGKQDVDLLSHYLLALEVSAGVGRGDISVIAIATESGAAMFGLGSYAQASPRLFGLLWGGEDLATDLGALTNREEDGRYAAPYQLARSLCLYAAADASVPAIDAVFTHFRDTAGLRAEATNALRAGFSAKAAIHPDQVPVINEVFSPSSAEIAHARTIVEAFQEHPEKGVLSIDGRMIDRPHYRNALRLLARAGVDPKAPGGPR